MAILAFQKPEKVIMLESTSNFGKFEFRPLEPGFGMTIGNALRRILLSSLEGYAITTGKVAGVDQRSGRNRADRRLYLELPFVLQSVESRSGDLPSVARNEDADRSDDR